MSSPEGKKRYSITLTVENVERFKSILKSVGASQAYMSHCIDDFIRDMSDSMETLKEHHEGAGRPVGLRDLFWVLGKQMEEMLRDEKEYCERRNDAKPTQEAEKMEG